MRNDNLPLPAGNVIEEIGLNLHARKIIDLAIDEAQRLNQDTVGTEHLLLSIVRDNEGIAAGILDSLGLHLDKVLMQLIR